MSPQSDRSELAVPRTSVEQFSARRLANGDVRTIAVLSRAGDRPVLGVTIFRRGAVLTKVLFFEGGELDAVDSAIRRARDPHLSAGRHDAGDLPIGGPLRLQLWTEADGVRPPVVVFRRHIDGQYVGGPTTLGGRELDALETALHALRTKITAASAAQQENTP